MLTGFAPQRRSWWMLWETVVELELELEGLQKCSVLGVAG
jgi:hypothetical protein